MRPVKLAVVGSSDKLEVPAATEVKLFITDYQGYPAGWIEALVIPNLVDVVAVNWEQHIQQFPYLKNVRVPSSVRDGKFDLLIGSNCGHLTATLESRFIPGIRTLLLPANLT